jgi:Zn-dependent protease with chaperone function
MRIATRISKKWLMLLAASLLLAGCVPSLLIGNQLQSKLMWAFLEPLVGFNPNNINFFEAPIVKDRMVALLGDKYEPAMKLLRTANQIQQEGALYYVVSRYAPPEAQAIVDTAGLVWNADTNQMAVMLVQNGAAEIVAEQVAAGQQAIIAKLPTELQTTYNQAMELKNAMDTATQQVEDAKAALPLPEDPILELIRQKENEY